MDAPAPELVGEEEAGLGLRYERSVQVATNPGYLYAHSVMYDETAGVFKLWACGSVNGDFIVYKEASSLDGLDAAPWHHALAPLHNGAFDHTHTCDPKVIRVGGHYYLYYGGLNEAHAPSHRTTRIGVAISHDGGRSFARLHGGNPIVTLGAGQFAPGSYGVGQPAVARGPGGWYYMIYTHQDGTTNLLRVIRSQDPAFGSYQPVRDIAPHEIGGWSVDMAWNPARQQFLVVANAGTPASPVKNLVTSFDAAFNKLDQATIGANPGYRFGEGIGVLTDSLGNLSRRFSGGRHELTFVGATHGPYLPGTEINWVTGPSMAVTFTQGPGGFIPSFEPNGWDIGVYNPFGTDGNLYIRQGDASGVYGDDTAWHWGVHSGTPLSGDFDGDGYWDFALYNPLGAGRLYIQYGNGAGGFGRQTSYHWGPVTGQPLAGDFNGDGRWDLALYNPNGLGNLYVRYGLGNGQFATQTSWRWGVLSGQAFTGDFDGDGFWDLGLYKPFAAGDFYIQYGNGAGGFGRQTHWQWPGISTGRIFTGDFNRDGKWDIGLHNPLGDGRLFMQYGNGAGRFGGQTAMSWVGTGHIVTGHFRN